MTVQPTVQTPIVTIPGTTQIANGPTGANGQKLIDATGIVSGALTSLLRSVSFGAVSGITAPSVPTVVTGSVVSFTLTRTATVLVQGTINVGSNCAAGLFNLLALSGDGGLTLLDELAWPYAILAGIGAGTINYMPVTLFAVASGTPGAHTVNFQVDAATNGSVTVNNGNLDVFLLGS